MAGVILQLNVSDGGVPKYPLACGAVSRLGIAGDRHRYRFHGGPGKALLLMAAEVIESLAAEGFAVYFGALGENLTVRHLNYHAWSPGQRYCAGSVLLQLTEPRAPCKQLRRYGAGIEKRISREPGASGFYAAVLEEGSLARGDRIERMEDPL